MRCTASNQRSNRTRAEAPATVADRRWRSQVAAIALVAIGLEAGAWAQEGGALLRATDTLMVEYNADNQNRDENDDDYGIAVNRLNLSGTAGDITASLRVDSTAFFYPDPDREPIERFQDDIARLERLTARYTLGDWTLTAGDYFTQLGRGVALAIRKVPEVGLDLSIRGGELEYDGNEHAVSLFAGLINTANLDSVSKGFVEDVDDIVAGASYELRALDAVDLGVYGLYFEPSERLLEARDFTTSGGVYAELDGLADWLTLYLEGDVQHRRLAGTEDQGYGGYVTADLVFGDLGVLLEGLYLHAYELRGSRNSALNSRFVYNQAPTLERIDQEVLNNDDVVGGRLRAEYYVLDWDVLFYANAMLRLNYPGEPVELRQIHGYAGTEIYLQQGLGRLALSGGYRDETQLAEHFKSMAHAEADLLYPLGERLSVHLTSTNELRTLRDDPYQRGSTLAGLDLSRLGGLTVEFGYDTQNRYRDIRNFFLAGILYWEITDALQLTLTGGAQRGGIKCINGVCRDFPEFTGARGVLVGRF